MSLVGITLRIHVWIKKFLWLLLSWTPLVNIHCMYFIEESLKILEISEHPPSVLLQWESWQVTEGVRNLFSGSLDPPSEHHLYWFLTSFWFRYLLWRSLWRERRRIQWQNCSGEFWWVVRPSLGYRPVKCDLEASLLLSPLLRPFNWSQRLWLLMSENDNMAWWYAFLLWSYLCSILEMLFWWSRRVTKPCTLGIAQGNFWKEILS